MATGFGKRNASLDLRTESGAEAMDALLDDTDVWIDAYRPGALEAHGFSAERAAARRPGVVVVQISAFDWTGPWAGRRGFDSIVQSTTGVRWAGGEAAVDGAGAPLDRGPIGLPVQALDYATGFLAAGVAAQLVAHQRSVGGSWLARLSLLRTRNWLVARGGPNPIRAILCRCPPAVPPRGRFRLRSSHERPAVRGAGGHPTPAAGNVRRPAGRRERGRGGDGGGSFEAVRCGGSGRPLRSLRSST